MAALGPTRRLVAQHPLTRERDATAIAASVLAAFALAHDGRAASLAMLRGFVTALPGFAAFFFAAAIALG